MKKYKKSIPKVKENLSKIKKKYKKPVLKNKKIIDIVVKEYKKTLSDSLSDSFINKEEKPPKSKKIKIPKSNNFIDKEQTVSEKIVINQLKIPKTNIFEAFVVCFGSLYNKVLINE